MPSFFKKQPRSSQFSTLTNPVSLQAILPTLEKFFGILNRKIGNLASVEAFALLRLTGFTNVYGITCSDKGVSKDDTLLRVEHLDKLKAFLMAENFEHKKSLYLAHAEQVIENTLKHYEMTDSQIAAFQPIIQHINSTFQLQASELLQPRKHKIKKRLPDKTYASKRELAKPSVVAAKAHIGRLQSLSEQVTMLVLSSLSIKDAAQHYQHDSDVDAFKQRLRSINGVTISDKLLSESLTKLDTLSHEASNGASSLGIVYQVV